MAAGNGSAGELPLNPAVVRLLDLFYALDDRSPIAFFDALYQTRFTGEVTFHFGLGIPRRVEFGQPVSLPLGDTPGRTP